MGLIIQEVRNLDDGTEVVEGVYRGASPPSSDDIARAEHIDRYLKSHLRSARDQLMAKGVLKGRKGNADRWYHLGLLLAETVDNQEIVAPDDRANDFYIWIAIEQNAPRDIHPNKIIRHRKNTWTKRNHFRLSYLLAKRFDKTIVDRHTWREWVEILESPAITGDDRILEWVSKRMGAEPEMSLRPLARSLRQGLIDMHVDVLTQEELVDLLDPLWEEARG